MSVSTEASYFSRFLVKFIEIIAAGLATAVSGYLIAHLSGALPSAAPVPAAAVNQATPSAGAPSGSPVQPSLPVSLDTNKQPPAPQQDNAPPVAQPGQTMADTKKTEGPRKRVENATNAAQSNHQRKPLLARVRAALTNVDAKRTDPLEAALPSADVTRPSAAAAQPVTAPPAINSPPITAGEVRSAPNQALPVYSNPLPKVEVTSRPIAEPPSTEMSPLEQRLRQDPLIGTVDPPRPPMPVAQ
ncbi:MAG: hypothetical protein ACTHJS_16740 [Xanthobacteraceae bacterium]